MWGAEDLGASSGMIAESLCTEVRTTFAGPERERGRTISSEATDAARELLAELRTRGLLPRKGRPRNRPADGAVIEMGSVRLGSELDNPYGDS